MGKCKMTVLERNGLALRHDGVPGVAGVERDVVAGGIEELGAGVVRVFGPGYRDGVAVTQYPALAPADGLHDNCLLATAGGAVGGGHHFDHDIFDVDLFAGIAVNVRCAGHGAGIVIGGGVVFVIDLVATVGVLDVDV